MCGAYVNVCQRVMHMCMYVHVSHPKNGATIAQLPKARQDALVGSRTAG